MTLWDVDDEDEQFILNSSQDEPKVVVVDPEGRRKRGRPAAAAKTSRKEAKIVRLDLDDSLPASQNNDDDDILEMIEVPKPKQPRLAEQGSRELTDDMKHSTTTGPTALSKKAQEIMKSRLVKTVTLDDLDDGLDDIDEGIRESSKESAPTFMPRSYGFTGAAQPASTSASHTHTAAVGIEDAAAAGPPAAATTAAEEDKLTLVCVCKLGEARIKFGKHEPMQKLLVAFRKVAMQQKKWPNITESTPLRLLFDGDAVEADATAEDLELDDEDKLDVVFK